MQSRLRGREGRGAGVRPARVRPLHALPGTDAHDGRVGQRRRHRAAQPAAHAGGDRRRAGRAGAPDARAAATTCCARAWWSSRASSDRLYRVVRLAAKETGKQVKLDIVGGSIEIDRGVLDRMTGAFEHLLRNCVAHGIETPRRAQRRRQGRRPAPSSITLAPGRQRGRASSSATTAPASTSRASASKAVEHGPDRAPAQRRATPSWRNLIFMPGFSTADAGDRAGRPRHRHGRGALRSQRAWAAASRPRPHAGPGHELPAGAAADDRGDAGRDAALRRARPSAVPVDAGRDRCAARRPRKSSRPTTSGTYEFGGEHAAVLLARRAAAVIARAAPSRPGKTLPVVVVPQRRSSASRVHVDEVLGNQEVVVKNLGPQLARLPGLAGMTLLASGAVVLIYNPVALATLYGEQARARSADRAQPDVLAQAPARAGAPTRRRRRAAPLVLVVDDSLTVRRVTQRLLAARRLPRRAGQGRPRRARAAGRGDARRSCCRTSRCRAWTASTWSATSAATPRWRDLPVDHDHLAHRAEAPRAREASSASTTTSASPTRKRNCWRWSRRYSATATPRPERRGARDAPRRPPSGRRPFVTTA